MNVFEQNLGPSWKTTVAGAVTFVAVFLQNAPWPYCHEIGTALLAAGVGAGFLVAKDSDVSHAPAPLQSPDNVAPVVVQQAAQANGQQMTQPLVRVGS
jgi:hypothetical protein